MVNVGRLRQASALCDACRNVVIVSDNPAIQNLKLRVVEVFPDTTDENGCFANPSFKIKVEV